MNEDESPNAIPLMAVIDTLGAVVMSLSATLPAAQRQAFVDNLAKLAQAACTNGGAHRQPLLNAMARAAR